MTWLMNKILIIEDDRDYCELVQRKLTHEGFAVRSAANLKEGLQLIVSDQPDAVLLDLGLPDSPMSETVERVKRFATTAIIVVLSGHPDAAKDCIMQSASGFVNKNDGLTYIGQEIRNAIKSFSKIQNVDSALCGLKQCHAS